MNFVDNLNKWTSRVDMVSEHVVRLSKRSNSAFVCNNRVVAKKNSRVELALVFAKLAILASPVVR